MFRLAARTAQRNVFSRGALSSLNHTHTQQVRAFSSSKQDTPLSETVRDFLDVSEFHGALKRHDMDFYTGVPDSLLKDFCSYVTDNVPASNHVITSNEGSAVAIGAGYHLATGKAPIVYLQNSGFGNCVNPLLSMADSQIYSIPMLLLIGWRGEPGKKDEPQHMVQGKVMSALLADMGIPFDVLPDYIEGATDVVANAAHHIESRKSPFALLVKRQTFAPYKLQSVFPAPAEYDCNREQALKLVLGVSNPWDVFVSTTGFMSREVYEYRADRGEGHNRDFLCVGNMGYASSVAFGIAQAKPSRNVFCLDGDGALFMHMGSMTTTGSRPADNLKHIVFNNGCHDSVGGQPTPGWNVDIPAMATAAGYKWARTASTKEDILAQFKELSATKGPALLEIRIRGGARKDLGRPKTSPRENKIDFMNFLQD